MPKGALGLTFQIPIYTIDQGHLAKMSGSAALVLMVIARHRNFKTGNSWPSAKTITEEAGVSRTGVFKALKRLVEQGLITRKRGQMDKGFVNFYRLVPDHEKPRPFSANKKNDKGESIVQKSGREGNSVRDTTICTEGVQKSGRGGCNNQDEKYLKGSIKKEGLKGGENTPPINTDIEEIEKIPLPKNMPFKLHDQAIALRRKIRKIKTGIECAREDGAKDSIQRGMSLLEKHRQELMGIIEDCS
jgi:DNA-binding MarR family transcriptional regulator